MEDLNGRVAVVTGGASGVGKGVAKALLGEGCTVVLADIEQGALDTAVAELSALGPVSGIVTDVSDFDWSTRSPSRSTPSTAPATSCSTTPASRRAVAASRGSRSPTTGSGASASTSSASSTACWPSCRACSSRASGAG